MREGLGAGERRSSVAGALAVLLGLSAGLAASCGGQADEGLTAKLIDCNSKTVALEKELAETKVARDTLKKELAKVLANGSGHLALKDPEIIELVASARKEAGLPADIDKGGLDPKEASRIVLTGATALQGCYERALKKNAGLQMRSGLGVTLGITVKPTGAVDAVDVNPAVDPDLTKCMRQTITHWKFPTFAGQPVTIEQKLTLTPKT